MGRRLHSDGGGRRRNSVVARVCCPRRFYNPRITRMTRMFDEDALIRGIRAIRGPFSLCLRPKAALGHSWIFLGLSASPCHRVSPLPARPDEFMFVLLFTPWLAWKRKQPIPADRCIIRDGDPFRKPLKPCDLAPIGPARPRGFHSPASRRARISEKFFSGFLPPFRVESAPRSPC